jgi:hypothetical protein
MCGGLRGYNFPTTSNRPPRVSAFTSADIPKILDLKPDLVLTFSDLQADIAATRSSALTSMCTRSISAPSRKFST